MFFTRGNGRAGNDTKRRRLLGIACDADVSRQSQDPRDSSGFEGYPYTHPSGYTMSRRDRRARATGRRGETVEPFIKYFRSMLVSPAFANLTPNGHKTLNYLASQWRWKNNGDLDISEKNARKRGWRISGASLRRGAAELLEAGFIEQTRQGDRNKASLYGLSWCDFFTDDKKFDYPVANPTYRWKNKNGSSRVIQLESPVAQSPLSGGSKAETASPMAQSAAISLTH